MGLVYSTNKDFMESASAVEKVETLEPQKKKLVVAIDRRNRGGKQVTLVKGFVGSDDDLTALSKTLKNKCGTGGSAKDGEIIIQGDFRDKVLNVLVSLGYGAKRGN